MKKKIQLDVEDKEAQFDKVLIGVVEFPLYGSLIKTVQGVDKLPTSHVVEVYRRLTKDTRSNVDKAKAIDVVKGEVQIEWYKKQKMEVPTRCITNQKERIDMAKKSLEKEVEPKKGKKVTTIEEAPEVETPKKRGKKAPVAEVEQEEIEEEVEEEEVPVVKKGRGKKAPPVEEEEEIEEEAPVKIKGAKGIKKSAPTPAPVAKSGTKAKAAATNGDGDDGEGPPAKKTKVNLIRYYLLQGMKEEKVQARVQKELPHLTVTTKDIVWNRNQLIGQGKLGKA